MSKRARAEHTPEVIAAALAEADTGSDVSVAARYGVTKSTISSWRAKAAADPQIAKLLAAHRRALSGWRAEAERTYIATAKAIRGKAEGGEDIPFSLIATAKTYGAALLQADALLGDGEGDDDEP